MPRNSAISEQLPHRRMEAWKWTDVRRVVSDDAKGMSSVMTPRFTPPEGVKVSTGQGHPSDHVMGSLAQNFALESWNIYIPPGTKAAESLLIEDLQSGHARIALMVDKDAEITLIEHHKGNTTAFANIDMNIHLAEDAKLTRIIVQNDPEDMTRISTTCIAAETGAQIEQYVLSFGGALTRLETRLNGEGENISAVMNGAYLLSGKRHADLTSHTDLQHPNCMIRQAVKGVVTDKAKGVFQGKFQVAKDAQHTDAEMRHDALMLSDRAEIRAKPELEIYADDVACAHGNTIGALDESALFYMRQRGISLARAKAMLTQAFIADVFDDLADEDLKASLLAQITKWLETSYDI